ncbi:MAG: dTDP-4-dehydrorhamnose reductase [Bacteroidales bacterium]|nr:dTDP-4-dehydrorhamnose reductase [Bacteroidales bacterium]
MKIWVAGSKGQLGRTLGEQQDKLPGSEFIYTDIEELDLTQKEAVLRFARDEKPDWIVNCAAYTAVDKAEEEPEKAFLINRDVPAILSETADRTGARLLHISTDFVFGGDTDHPYKPTDKPKPLSIYAQTKFEGELEVLKYPQHLIVRTSWLYSVHGGNFVKTMLRLGREKTEIGVVADQVGCPTSATDLASAVLAILHKLGKERTATRQIYHYSNAGSCSWFDFASEVMKEAGLKCRVKPIPTEAYPLPARRPNYSVMDLSAIREDFGVGIPEWKESLGKVVRGLME